MREGLGWVSAFRGIFASSGGNFISGGGLGAGLQFYGVLGFF